MNKLLISLLLLMFSCSTPPADGCLDTTADNYDKKSDINCCCRYSCSVEFKSDSLDLAKFTYFIDSSVALVSNKLDMPKPTRTIKYIIKSKDTLFTAGLKNIVKSKVNTIQF